tara:strand:+ start:640 stop:1023 length:384 start_codon:yes stop_codon:yes gene_type:complete
MNDYSKISAENTSSRMATISAEETYFIGDIVKDSKPHTDVLKWSQRELVESKQFAYGDVDIYVVPVEGDIDKDKISRAINKKFPRQNPFGKLRWRGGWAVLVNGELGFKKTDRDNTVTVEEHFGLAD